MLAFLFASVLCLLNIADAVLPADEIKVESLPNTSFYIQDEVYKFILIPSYWVPLRIKKHIIYSASKQTVSNIAAGSTKKRSVISVSVDEYEALSGLFDGAVPSNFVVDSKRRSLETEGGGLRIDLAPGKFLLFTMTPDEARKRAVPLGSKACMHVPFFTTCDNSADLQQVKDALQASTNQYRVELDSIKRTNNARDQELANTLAQQQTYIATISQSSSDQLAQLLNLVGTEKTLLVMTQHGDQVIHGQVNALKRLTNALLRYANAIGSTDARAVVAQPAMAQLFRGFKLLLNEFKTNTTPEVRLPILDVRQFDFTETVLPDASVRNVTTNDGLSYIVGLSSNYLGFQVNLQYGCSPADRTSNFCLANKSTLLNSGWMYGPFHSKHWGIYPITSVQAPYTVPEDKSRESAIIVPQQMAMAASDSISLTCMNFLGFPVLTQFTSTPYLINGIPSSASPLDPSVCANYFLYTPPANSKYTHYKLFAMTEGITVPFYSNCKREDLVALDSGLVNRVGYLSGYPSVTSAYGLGLDTTDSALYQQHYVSATCYINIDPDWIGLSYYITQNVSVIKNISRGYKFNQFTINPQGELASSLEFVYTPQWGVVYNVKRISTDFNSTDGNRVIVDEIDLLDNSKVLFSLTPQNTIIDEGDHMYGAGNNGRDCIQVPFEQSVDNMEYDYDITDCFFQNDQTGYPVTRYTAGLIRTSGISRFNNKFTFDVKQLGNFFSPNNVSTAPYYQFTLTPRADSDFRFYVVTKPQVCPQMTKRIVTQNANGGGCSFDFFYSGSETVYINGTEVNPFVNQFSFANFVNISSMPYSVTTSTHDCLVVTCKKTLTSTYVLLETPSFSIVSKADKDLVANVQSSLNDLMKGSLSDLDNLQAQVMSAKDRVDHITDLLNSIDFNVSRLFPYEDFAALREQVDAIIGKVGDNYCSGPFASIKCWLEDSAQIIITVLVILVVVALVTLFLFKTNIGFRIRRSVCGSEDDPETPSGKPEGSKEDCVDDKKKKKKPVSDFQLLATN